MPNEKNYSTWFKFIYFFTKWFQRQIKWSKKEIKTRKGPAKRSSAESNDFDTSGGSASTLHRIILDSFSSRDWTLLLPGAARRKNLVMWALQWVRSAHKFSNVGFSRRIDPLMWALEWVRSAHQFSNVVSSRRINLLMRALGPARSEHRSSNVGPSRRINLLMWVQSGCARRINSLMCVLFGG